MVKRKECLAMSKYGEWRFEWYVNEGGNSPAADYYQERGSAKMRKMSLPLFLSFSPSVMGSCATSSASVARVTRFAFKPKPHRSGILREG